MEDVTLNKRKLDIYLEDPSFLQSHRANENAVPRGPVLQGALLDNSATRRLLQMGQHTLEMNSEPSSKSQKIEVKSAPVKRQVFILVFGQLCNITFNLFITKVPLLKPLLSESTSKPKEVEKKQSQMKQTAIRVYHGPLKSVTNTHPLGHSSLPEV